MAFLPWFSILGQPSNPQFGLKDFSGQLWGVFEHYNTDKTQEIPAILLECIPQNPTEKSRPKLWLNLESWELIEDKHSKSPDHLFQKGLQSFIQNWPETEKEIRKMRCEKSRYVEIIRLAENGYSIAYQEIFYKEKKQLPLIHLQKQSYWVDDQYLLQPGAPNHQITLVLLKKTKIHSEKHPVIVNWQLGSGFEIIQGSLPENELNQTLISFEKDEEIMKKYRFRLKIMREKGVKWDLKPWKPLQF